jgi:integrase
LWEKATYMNITKRIRRRVLKGGAVILQIRWVVSYREPGTGKRKQLFFERHTDARPRSNRLAAQIETGAYSHDRNKLTVAEAAGSWLANRHGQVKPRTLEGYRQALSYVVGPLLIGSPLQRGEFTLTGKALAGTRTVPMLGQVKVQDLATSQIRAWHRTVAAEVGLYSANRAKMFLAAALALAAEDSHVRPPPMPTNIGRGKPKSKKPILTAEQVATLLKSAREDRERGIYVAFPFLAGTRPSEQLGLLWEDVDFDANVIRIRRMQERDGTITDLTKTLAGSRDIPMCSLLRSQLMEWRLACPRRGGELRRVFPGPGRLQPWPLPRLGGGGPLLYGNFRRRFWVPMLKRLANRDAP